MFINLTSCLFNCLDMLKFCVAIPVVRSVKNAVPESLQRNGLYQWAVNNVLRIFYRIAVMCLDAPVSTAVFGASSVI